MTDRFRDNLNPPLYKPEYWDRVQYLDLHGNYLDTAFLCAPVGLPRIGAPVRIVQQPGEVILMYNNRNTGASSRPTAGRTARRTIGIRRTWATRSATGTATRWSSKRSGSTTRRGSRTSATAPGWFHTTDMRVVETVPARGQHPVLRIHRV